MTIIKSTYPSALALIEDINGEQLCLQWIKWMHGDGLTTGVPVHIN